MAEAETPHGEPVEQNESLSHSPDPGQEPTTGRSRSLVLVGVIAALLATVTLACICLLGILWLQARSSQTIEAALSQQEEVGPMVQREAPTAEAEVFGQRAPREGAPTIEYFWANPPLIKVGQCSTLQWGFVLGASKASIEPGIGGIGTPGSTVVCPDKTTTYVLTAEGPGGQTSASATVSVGAGGESGTLVLQSEGPLDGYRSNDGRGSAKKDILVANAELSNTVGEVVWRGFMSFDLSAIPRIRPIQWAELRFFQARVGGDPYGKLGRLVLEHVAYGDRLDDAAFYVVPMDAVVLEPQTERETWYVYAAPKLNNWLYQDMAAGRNRFQVRLRWERETDGDGREDHAAIESPEGFFGTGNAPQLKVIYGP